MKKAVFNGHTWIVSIVAVAILGGMGIYAEYFITTIYGSSGETMKLIEIGGFAGIPIITINGIIRIIDRLTYLPTKEVK